MVEKKINPILVFLEYIVVFSILVFLCYYFNKNIKILGLYMDDLYNWSYFPETNLWTFAFKFYPNATRYRPFYDMMQYIEYYIVQHKCYMFSYINYFINAVVGLFVYCLSKKINKNVFLSFCVSILFLFSHFSYYQIGQATGLIETIATFLALLILYNCILTIENNDRKNFVFHIILFFLIAFTHERYMSLFGIIFFSVVFGEIIHNEKTFRLDERIHNIIKKIIVFGVEIFVILFIRKIAIGKIVPAGTGGTYVEDTFSISSFVGFCKNQVEYILGMNNGPDYLCGINFVDLNDKIKEITKIHIILCVFVFILYFIFKNIYIYTNKQRKKENRQENWFIYLIKNFYIDFLILGFIVLCIIFSSVTIRIEMRFVYVSFVGFLIYISYMISYIMHIPYENNVLKIFSKVLCLIFFVFVIASRFPAEKVYRDNFKNIYFFLDQDRMNNLYMNTIGKYGEDIIDKKQIYILNNTYGMTKFYGDYFFQIYQKNYELRPIKFETNFDFLKDISSDDSIVFAENYDIRGYEEINIEEYKRMIYGE